MQEHLAGSVGADLADGWRESNVGSSGHLPGLWRGEGAGAQPGKGAGGEVGEEGLEAGMDVDFYSS